MVNPSYKFRKYAPVNTNINTNKNASILGSFIFSFLLERTYNQSFRTSRVEVPELFSDTWLIPCFFTIFLDIHLLSGNCLDIKSGRFESSAAVKNWEISLNVKTNWQLQSSEFQRSQSWGGLICRSVQLQVCMLWRFPHS